MIAGFLVNITQQLCQLLRDLKKWNFSKKTNLLLKIYFFVPFSCMLRQILSLKIVFFFRASCLTLANAILLTSTRFLSFLSPHKVRWIYSKSEIISPSSQSGQLLALGYSDRHSSNLIWANFFALDLSLFVSLVYFFFEKQLKLSIGRCVLCVEELTSISLQIGILSIVFAEISNRTKKLVVIIFDRELIFRHFHINFCCFRLLFRLFAHHVMFFGWTETFIGILS